MALNKTIIQGHICADPVLRYTQSGKPVASFTVAWSEKYNENEQKVFLPCVAWQNQAEFVSKYFTKGQEIAVEGKLVSRKWTDKNGNDRETIELIVDRAHFCGPKRESGGYGDHQNYGQYFAAPARSTGVFAEMDDDDGDLPF